MRWGEIYVCLVLTVPFEKVAFVWIPKEVVSIMECTGDDSSESLLCMTAESGWMTISQDSQGLHG